SLPSPGSRWASSPGASSTDERPHPPPAAGPGAALPAAGPGGGPLRLPLLLDAGHLAGDASVGVRLPTHPLPAGTLRELPRCGGPGRGPADRERPPDPVAALLPEHGHRRRRHH